MQFLWFYVFEMCCFMPFLFPLLLSQCHGKPFPPQSQPAARWGGPVQLPNHVAGVCRGSGLLEGVALDLCHCSAVSWHRLLCEWGATLRGKPAWTGALEEPIGEEADASVLASVVCSQFLKVFSWCKAVRDVHFFFLQFYTL